ncbi:MAG: hypothetical protein HYZ28_00475 [Myxococcales bacterium]|nr:hypothetical protein [Myxococcales bacterium]
MARKADRTVDLLVVGGGPAGCAAASAARARAKELSVLLIDRARFPRDKLCAGAITGGGLWELERARLALRVPKQEVSVAAFRVDGATRRVPLPRACAVVRRRELDADLLEQVRKLGVEVLEEAPLERFEDGIASTGAGRIAFRAAVCCDGAGGPSRRLLGLTSGQRVPLREALASSRGQDALLFDFDAGLPGYAWRFPCREAGREVENCGVYSYAPRGNDARGSRVDLSSSLREWAAREGLAHEKEDAFSIRLAEPFRTVGRGPVLLAGEALGADPLTGEGIRYALWSGRIAGSLAAGASSFGRAPSLERYRASLALSRSGVTLWLFARIAARFYGPNASRWRKVAADEGVARAVAALVCGHHPASPLAQLAATGALRAAFLSRSQSRTQLG